MPAKKKQQELTQEELFPHGGFHYRLVYTDDGNRRTCWFQCENHLVKHVNRYKITEGTIHVRDGHTLEADPLAPKKKRTRKPSGTKASQTTKTKKATKTTAKTTRATRASKTSKKEAFSNLDTFFDK